MNSDSSEKVAIVTGGSRGIGRAISVELARHRYFVVINYKSNHQAADETIEMIRRQGGDGETVKFDVSHRQETAAAVKEISSRRKNIEVLVNNAGITADGLFIMMSEDDWDSVIGTTLKGFYNITKPVLSKMVRRKKGSIVSISLLPNEISRRFSQVFR